MFSYETVVRLYHSDAAGVLFYGRLFEMAHDCFEAFFEGTYSIAAAIENRDVLTPISHTEADYHLAMRVGDKMRIEMENSKIGDRSFELTYRFLNSAGELAAEVKTVHVAVDGGSGQVVELPVGLKDKLVAG